MSKSAKSRRTGRPGRTRTGGAPTTGTLKPAAKKKARAGAGSAPRTSTAGKPATRKEEAAFVETLIASGEAARLDEQGQLPAGATHKIVEDEAGHVTVVRRRFSMT